MNKYFKLCLAIFVFAAFNISGQFLPAENFTPQPENESVGPLMAVGDLNGDAKEDVVAFVDGDLLVFPALGLSFDESIRFDLNLISISWDFKPLIQDMDNDGDHDIILQKGWIENINFDFTEYHVYEAASDNDNFLLIADFNQDNYPDVVVTDLSTNNSNGSSIIFNDGAGEFLLQNTSTFSTEVFYSLSASDIDGDGSIDLFSGGLNSSSAYLNDGFGNFSGPINMTGILGTSMLADVNGDGLGDLLSPGCANFWIQLNLGGMSFAPAISIAMPECVSAWYGQLRKIAYDYDGDTDMDILFDAADNDTFWIRNDSNLGFSFAGRVERFSNGMYTGHDWLDSNDDGRLDAIRCYGTLTCAIQDSNGMQVANDIISQGMTVAEGENFMASYDADEDGDPDLFSSGLAGMGYYENMGDGEFSSVQFIACYTELTLIGMTDINDDGLKDIVSMGKTIDGSHGRGLFYNLANINGGYHATNTILNFTGRHDFDLFDANGDGIMDIVDFEHMPGYTASWYSFDLQNGLSAPHVLGSWTNDTGVGTSDNLHFTISSGDFNGDGNEDLAFAKDGSLRIFESDGTGNFIYVNPDRPLGAGEFLNMVSGESRDLDNDGKVDLVYQIHNSSNSNSTKFGYFTQNSSGVYMHHAINVTNQMNFGGLPSGVLSDIDVDGDADILFLDPGHVRVLTNSGNGAFTTSFVTTLSLDNPNMEFLTVTDIDLDGLPDVLVGVDANENNQIEYFKAINNLDSPYQVHCHVFYDEDGNGIKDPGEPGISNRQIQFSDNWGYAYSNEDGEFTLYGIPGSITASIDQDPLIWIESTSWSQSASLDVANPSVDFYFGMQPNGIQPIVEGLVTAPVGICGTNMPQWLTITNVGNTVASGYFTYQLDPRYTLVESNVVPEILPDNNFRWNYDNLYFSNQIQVLLDVVSPLPAFIGDTTHSSLETIVLDLNNTVVHTHLIHEENIVSCSFDPNSKEVDTGYTAENFVFAGTMLDYTIHFQNTGNAPAATVRIEDQLSEKLDWSTMQTIASSHDFELFIESAGRAMFTFNNINLPDSLTDPLNSQGFVRFRIQCKGDLPAGDIVENSASIFFDLNEPIITNTVINTVYDCVDLEQALVSSVEVCAGEEITCSNNAIWIENLTWSFNGNDVGTGNYTHTVDANGSLTMHVSNALCEYSQDFELTANTADASFTASGNTLTANDAASYQWYLNGIEIAGATQQAYEISETGNYSLMVLNENGCVGASETQLVLITSGKNEIKEDIVFYPVPCDDVLNCVFSKVEQNDVCFVWNAQGILVYQSAPLKSNRVKIDCSNWPAGCYMLSVGDSFSKIIVN
jgi:uncharacterized repeat protein (TIGR01451 family)